MCSRRWSERKEIKTAEMANIQTQHFSDVTFSKTSSSLLQSRNKSKRDIVILERVGLSYKKEPEGSVVGKQPPRDTKSLRLKVVAWNFFVPERPILTQYMISYHFFSAKYPKRHTENCRCRTFHTEHPHRYQNRYSTSEGYDEHLPAFYMGCPRIITLHIWQYRKRPRLDVNHQIVKSSDTSFWLSPCEESGFVL